MREKPIFRNLILLFLVVLVATSQLGCDLFDDGDDDETYSATINTFDVNGNAVAAFEFTQIGDNIFLEVRSLASQDVSITYVIDFSLNFAAWQNQGDVARLPSGGSVDKGRIQTNGARVDLGNFVIAFTSLTYL